MAVYCEQGSLLFLMAPRTGSSAVWKLLHENFGGVFLPLEDVVDASGHLVIGRKHCTIPELMKHGYLQQRDLPGLLKFTTVRNPFDSLASLYIKRRDMAPKLENPDFWAHKQPNLVKMIRYCQDHTFDEWVKLKYHRGWFKKMIGYGKRSIFSAYTTGADRVLRFETLQPDMAELLHSVGLDSTKEIPRFNTTKNRESDYRQYYTESSRRIVENTFGDEIRRLGYQF